MAFHPDYLGALRSVGYDTIPETRPNMAIKYILNRLKPHYLNYLKTRMVDIILRRKNEQLDKKYFNAFMRMIATQAKQQ